MDGKGSNYVESDDTKEVTMKHSKQFLLSTSIGVNSQYRMDAYFREIVSLYPRKEESHRAPA